MAPSRIKIDLMDKPLKSFRSKEDRAKEQRSCFVKCSRHRVFCPEHTHYFPFGSRSRSVLQVQCTPLTGADQGSVGCVVYTSEGKWIERVDLTFLRL